MALALADEAHQLEPVDVRHVDVGDDELVGRARQEPERVEPARRLDDLEIVAQLRGAFERGAHVGPHRSGVFDEEDPDHEPARVSAMSAGSQHRSRWRA